MTLETGDSRKGVLLKMRDSKNEGLQKRGTLKRDTSVKVYFRKRDSRRGT